MANNEDVKILEDRRQSAIVQVNHNAMGGGIGATSFNPENVNELQIDERGKVIFSPQANTRSFFRPFLQVVRYGEISELSVHEPDEISDDLQIAFLADLLLEIVYIGSLEDVLDTESRVSEPDLWYLVDYLTVTVELDGIDEDSFLEEVVLVPINLVFFDGFDVGEVESPRLLGLDSIFPDSTVLTISEQNSRFSFPRIAVFVPPDPSKDGAVDYLTLMTGTVGQNNKEFDTLPLFQEKDRESLEIVDVRAHQRNITFFNYLSLNNHYKDYFGLTTLAIDANNKEYQQILFGSKQHVETLLLSVFSEQNNLIAVIPETIVYEFFDQLRSLSVCRYQSNLHSMFLTRYVLRNTEQLLVRQLIGESIPRAFGWGSRSSAFDQYDTVANLAVQQTQVNQKTYYLTRSTIKVDQSFSTKIGLQQYSKLFKLEHRGERDNQAWFGRPSFCTTQTSKNLTIVENKGEYVLEDPPTENDPRKISTLYYTDFNENYNPVPVYTRFLNGKIWLLVFFSNDNCPISPGLHRSFSNLVVKGSTLNTFTYDSINYPVILPNTMTIHQPNWLYESGNALWNQHVGYVVGTTFNGYEVFKPANPIVATSEKQGVKNFYGWLAGWNRYSNTSSTFSLWDVWGNGGLAGGDAKCANRYAPYFRYHGNLCHFNHNENWLYLEYVP